MKNFKQIAAAFVLTIAGTTGVFAQEYIFPGAPSFLSITPDARSMGMGNTGIALNQGAFGIFHNAAANLSGDAKYGVGYSYSPWMRSEYSGYNLHTIGAFYNIDSKNGLSLGFRYFGQPDIDMTDELYNITGVAKPSDLAIDLAYSRHIYDNLYASLTVRMVNSDLDNGADKATAVGFDLGLFYKKEIKSFIGAEWSAGLSIANIGSKIDYGTEKLDMPGWIKAGGGVYLPFAEDHKLTAALDLAYQITPSDISLFEAGIGAEYNFFKYGVVRAGYHIGDSDKSLGSYGTAGLGFIVGPVRGDFSYIFADSESAINNTMLFSVSFKM